MFRPDIIVNLIITIHLNRVEYALSISFSFFFIKVSPTWWFPPGSVELHTIGKEIEYFILKTFELSDFHVSVHTLLSL